MGDGLKRARKAAQRTRTKVAEPEDTFRLAINGNELTGTKRDGKWTFICPSWPEIAAKHKGATGTADVTKAFCDKALAPMGDVIRAMKATFEAIQND